MLRVVLVDDEAPARRGLRRDLEAHSNVLVVGEAGNLADALIAIETHRPDALFLDIELSANSGFDLLAKTDVEFDVVFFTAHASYAPKAFEVAAVDYLLKPVDTARLAEALERLHARRALRLSKTAKAGLQPPLPALRVRVDREFLTIPADDICMLQAQGDFTSIVRSDGKAVLVGRLLGQIMADLPQPQFIRLNRSIVINLEQIDRIVPQPGMKWCLHLRAPGVTLPLSRRSSARLRQYWSKPAASGS